MNQLHSSTRGKSTYHQLLMALLLLCGWVSPLTAEKHGIPFAESGTPMVIWVEVSKPAEVVVGLIKAKDEQQARRIMKRYEKISPGYDNPGHYTPQPNVTFPTTTCPCSNPAISW